MGSWYLYFIVRNQRGPVWYSFTYRPTACMMRTSRPCSRQQYVLTTNLCDREAYYCEWQHHLQIRVRVSFTQQSAW